MKNEELEVNTFDFARNIAIRALGPRAKSRLEITQLLKKKNVEDEIITTVCDDLELHGYLNDLDFAQQWAESRARHKRVAKKIIEGELRSKGISQEFISEALADISTDGEYEMAKEVALKKYNSIAHLEKDVIYRRLQSLLSRKGYELGTISRVIKELVNQ
jgi:regulatory protein